MQIETGAREFFSNEGKDRDYIVFRRQDPVFVYERDKKDDAWIDYFYYREGLSKEDYFEWHFRDRWPLNFAPLVNKQFLDHLGIDIFGQDHDTIYGIMAKTFTGAYALPYRGKYVKWLYRFYVYLSFIQNGKLELTDEQRDKAHTLYKQDYSDHGPLREIYEFFRFPQQRIDYAFMRLAMQQHQTENK